MTHPLVAQYQFTRNEWLRGLEGLTEEDGSRHFGQMNCISWIVGHLAWHEQKYWLDIAQERILYPELNSMYAFNAPMSTPSFCEMLEIWQTVARETTPYLVKLTVKEVASPLLRKGKDVGQSVGSAMQRVIYHYWYHIGEIQSIRQLLGQKNLPVYVGNLEVEAPYRQE